MILDYSAGIVEELSVVLKVLFLFSPLTNWQEIEVLLLTEITSSSSVTVIPKQKGLLWFDLNK